MARLRKKQQPPPPEPSTTTSQDMSGSDSGLHVGGGGGSWSIRTQWILLAVASGACAAFNGVFAKLTTTDLTTNLSNAIAHTFGLSSIEGFVEIVVRGTFFALNLGFNAVMWSLFTAALAKGTSTTQVSIMNTSANFILTAFLGSIIFGEALPAMWWAGAMLLVAGNVIIGRKDETKDGSAEGEREAYSSVPGNDQEAEHDGDREEDVVDLGDLSDLRR